MKSTQIWAINKRALWSIPLGHEASGFSVYRWPLTVSLYNQKSDAAGGGGGGLSECGINSTQSITASSQRAGPLPAVSQHRALQDTGDSVVLLWTCRLSLEMKICCALVNRRLSS